MARQIEAYRLRTELDVDARKGSAAMKSFQKDVDSTTGSVKKLGSEIDKSGKNAEKAGSFFGKRFGGAATAAIEGSFDELGKTLGALVGTIVMPGVGTAIGSTIGSGLDMAAKKVAGVMMPVIKQGIELNKQIEQTMVEFKTFTGSEQQAIKYLKELEQLSIDTGNSFGWIIDTSEKIYDLTGNFQLANKVLRAGIEQAAEFGGGAETITKITDALGLMAESGELASRQLKTLYKVGIDAVGAISKATGRSREYVERMIKQGRVRGDIAAQVISEDILRTKGGFAKRLADTTTLGAERRAQALIEINAMRATGRATKEIGGFYRQVNQVLGGPGAEQFTTFIDQTIGGLIDKTKQLTDVGIKAGGNLIQGITEGITGSDALKFLQGAADDVSKSVTKFFDEAFKSQSPSQLMIDEVGIPIGEGIALGIPIGVSNLMPMILGDLQEQLKKLLDDPHVRALLETLKIGEGGFSQGDVHNIYGRPKARIKSGMKHPGQVVPRSQWVRSPEGIPSSAAGDLQIVLSSWLATGGKNKDFSDPRARELSALQLIARHPGGLAALMSGDPAQLMAAAAKEFSSVPGQKIGGGAPLARQKWMQTYTQQFAKATGGAAGAVPVAVVSMAPRAIAEGFAREAIATAEAMRPRGAGGVTADERESWQRAIAGMPAPGGLSPISQALENAKKGEIEATARAAIAQVESAKIITQTAQQQVAAAQQVIDATAQQTEVTGELTEEQIKTIDKLIFARESMISQLSGAVGQVAGQIPSQQVGKKRGLFSKILGVAAPFLSFIPGVGPILSTIAGMASSVIGGDYAGAVSAGAAGFSSGGIFRRAPGGRSSTGTPLPPNLSLLSTMPTVNPFPRQFGGPVYEGQRYIVGERGPETFTAARNGYITPQGGGDGSLVAVAAELRAAIQHLNSMPANQVVMRGARGIVRAMDHDAGLIRLVSQRQRLA